MTTTTTTTTNVTDLLARFIHTYTDVGHSFFLSQRWTATTKTNEDNLRVVELSGTWEWIVAASTWSMFQRYLTFISALGWEYIERRALERKSWLRHIVYTQCIFHIQVAAFALLLNQNPSLFTSINIPTNLFNQKSSSQQPKQIWILNMKNYEKSGKKCFNCQTVKWDIPLTKEIQIDLFWDAVCAKV